MRAKLFHGSKKTYFIYCLVFDEILFKLSIIQLDIISYIGRNILSIFSNTIDIIY